MIISETPYRMSFAGGGTDRQEFFSKEPGAVLSAALDHHIYVTVGPRFESTVRVAYSTTEIVDHPSQLKHTIVREALEVTGLDGSLEITTIGDVPAGTGMGSSSSLTVGLLMALHAYKGHAASPGTLAREACEIEISRLRAPIGRQDQYIAAFGGLQLIRFNPDDSVHVEPVPCTADTLRELERHLLLFYTGQTRNANDTLEIQARKTEANFPTLQRMRDLAFVMRDALAGERSPDLDLFADLLHEGWEAKRSLVSGISTATVDDWYERARSAGARGGKILGAGGGGFLLLFAAPDRHDGIRRALGHPRELPVGLDPRGSRIVFIGTRR